MAIGQQGFCQKNVMQFFDDESEAEFWFFILSSDFEGGTISENFHLICS